MFSFPVGVNLKWCLIQGLSRMKNDFSYIFHVYLPNSFFLVKFLRRSQDCSFAATLKLQKLFCSQVNMHSFFWMNYQCIFRHCLLKMTFNVCTSNYIFSYIFLDKYIFFLCMPYWNMYSFGWVWMSYLCWCWLKKRNLFTYRKRFPSF